MKSNKVSDMWKVPFRQVYCDTFKECLRATFWCHVVIKVFPHVIDLEKTPFLAEYKKDPAFFRDQYMYAIDAAERSQKGLPPRSPLTPYSA